jgi:hypothetical protein
MAGIPDVEHDLLLGITEFELSVRAFHGRRFDEAEHYLKEALMIVKKAS